jgi:hypothetical protein
MLRVEAKIRNDDQIPFSIAWAGTDRISPERHPGLVHVVAERELKLSGYQLVFGCACFLGAAKLLLWGFLKLWLFEQHIPNTKV